LLLTTVENTEWSGVEWVGAERNGPLPTNNKLSENSLIKKGSYMEMKTHD
jgi:hypothetical protein